MSGLRLWLIRHGETEANTGVWSANPAETPLTPLGKEQALTLAMGITEQPDLLVVSPLRRAQETAQPLCSKWPNIKPCTWPIEEFLYLTPSRLKDLTPEEKKEQISHYWQRNDPWFRDGAQVESFAQFLERVAHFHHLLCEQKGFVIAVGHGHFFKAFQHGLIHGFTASPEWMRLFRQEEVAQPIKNGEIVQLYLRG
ncbi:MAG: histidine phosphatase family protein [Tatlockia sp.]|jgi:broad specificity phosphatase PhoE